MDKPAATVRLTTVVVGAAYAGALYISGEHLQAGLKQALSYLPAFAVLAVTLWDVWLWRQPFVHRFARRPVLAGTWRATLKPTADSHIPLGGNRGPIEAYVIITQSYWSISVRQYTVESRSESKAAMWSGGSTSSNKILTFTFANMPKQELESRSRSHLGTAAVDVVGSQPRILSGYYFTDRYTKGDMTLALFDRSVDHPDFDSAQAHCQP
jgi:SMODS-associating 2TM, beta-strand rich effector domain